MKLIEENIIEIFDAHYLVETINLNNKTILELGCGNAAMTKKIAQTGFDRKIFACEVDEIQHKKNLELNIENIEFLLCGAQKIPLEDESINIVLLFKSFHHIPSELMKEALKEIKRVLKPNGIVYICEPLFIGKHNELMSIFNDEQIVRENAFNAIKDSVENEEFKLFKEIFFKTKASYKNFQEFKNKHMNLTFHKGGKVKEDIEKKVEEKYNSFANENGETEFLNPFRVDILQKTI